MRFVGTKSLLLAAAVSSSSLPKAARAFSVSGLLRSASRRTCFVANTRRIFVSSSNDNDNDDDDDWFSDYDPSVYERKNDNNDWGGTSPNYGGGRNSYGGGRNSYGRNNYDNDSGHDYTRDTSRDNSSCDEDAINDLLAQRLRARKVGDFDTADSIRDLLLNEHSVGVFDRDKVWRTGLSPTFRQKQKQPQPQPQQRGRRPPRLRDRDFGPNGHDYELTSDAGDNTSSLTDDEIHEAIAERLQAKLNRNFDVADRIQYGLVDAGVYVHDGLKEWRADGIPYGDVKGGGRNSGRTLNSRSSNNKNQYVQSEYSDELTYEEMDIVTDLLEQRLKYKQNRDYLNADSIREDLKDRFNVYVDDRLGEWSVGGNFGDAQNASRTMSETMRSRPYAKSTHSLELPLDVKEEEVQNKINDRAEAKRNRNYDLADAIRDELMEEYNVAIHDKLKQWSVGGVFGDETEKRRLKRHANEYVRRGGGDVSGDDFHTISALVADRAKAKRDRNYELADDIRARLRDEFNVSLDDRSREWRVDTDNYCLSRMGSELGAQELTDEEMDYIESRLKERSILKKDRMYDEADAIRDELKEQYNVLVDDRTKEYKVVMSVGNNSNELDNRFAQEALKSQSSAYKQTTMDEELDDALDSILQDTYAADMEEDDEEQEDEETEYCLSRMGSDLGAQELTDEEMYSVLVDDRTTEYKVVMSVGNNSNELDNRFAQEALKSQSSAYKQTTMDEELDDALDSILQDTYAADMEEDDEEQEDEETETELEVSMTQEELSSMTVVQLKEKLRESGMAVSGRKDELISRLLGV